MHARPDAKRQATSVAIAALMLSLSVAVPFMERLDLFDGPIVEAQHEPGACHDAHDHTVCTLVGANATGSFETSTYALVVSTDVSDAPTEAPEVTSASFSEGHPSRAPPLA